MNLNNTLSNLRKTKESYFNLKGGDIVTFELFKNKLSCYYKYYSLYGYKNGNFIIDKKCKLSEDLYCNKKIYIFKIIKFMDYIYMPIHELITEDDRWIPKLLK
jgi:hypothetical protein